MIRSGSTDQLLEQLAQSDVLRLRNVSDQRWEGWSTEAIHADGMKATHHHRTWVIMRITSIRGSGLGGI